MRIPTFRIRTTATPIGRCRSQSHTVGLREQARPDMMRGFRFRSRGAHGLGSGRNPVAGQPPRPRSGVDFQGTHSYLGGGEATRIVGPGPPCGLTAAARHRGAARAARGPAGSDLEALPPVADPDDFRRPLRPARGGLPGCAAVARGGGLQRAALSEPDVPGGHGHGGTGQGAARSRAALGRDRGDEVPNLRGDADRTGQPCADPVDHPGARHPPALSPPTPVGPAPERLQLVRPPGSAPLLRHPGTARSGLHRLGKNDRRARRGRRPGQPAANRGRQLLLPERLRQQRPVHPRRVVEPQRQSRSPGRRPPGAGDGRRATNGRGTRSRHRHAGVAPGHRNLHHRRGLHREQLARRGRGQHLLWRLRDREPDGAVGLPGRRAAPHAGDLRGSELVLGLRRQRRRRLPGPVGRLRGLSVQHPRDGRGGRRLE